MKKFHCRDCGMDCAYHTSGSDEHQISRKVIQHMHEVHNIDVISAEFMLRIHNAIRNRKTADRISADLPAVPLVA